MQQTKNLSIIEILISHIFAIFKVSRPEAFEIETRPETFETETRKNGSRDCLETETKSRDFIITEPYLIYLFIADTKSGV